MRPSATTTDQFFRGVCDGPAATVAPTNMVWPVCGGSGAGVVDELGGGGILQQTAARRNSAATNLERIRESYRNSAFPRPRSAALPMKRLLAAAMLLVAWSAL